MLRKMEEYWSGLAIMRWNCLTRIRWNIENNVTISKCIWQPWKLCAWRMMRSRQGGLLMHIGNIIRFKNIKHWRILLSFSMYYLISQNQKPKQRAKMYLLQYQYSNSKFFHGSTTSRKNFNKIYVLFDEAGGAVKG